jgi:hypothetical protein
MSVVFPETWLIVKVDPLLIARLPVTVKLTAVIDSFALEEVPIAMASGLWTVMLAALAPGAEVAVIHVPLVECSLCQLLVVDHSPLLVRFPELDLKISVLNVPSVVVALPYTTVE